MNRTALLLAGLTIACASFDASASTPDTLQVVQAALEGAVGTPSGSIPTGLPAKLSVGLFEDTGSTWMKSSGVAWDVRYRYLTRGWANNWGYGANDGSYALTYMQEGSAQGQIPAFAYYEMNEQPGGWEESFYAKTQNAATMASYFSDFKLLMQRAKDFGKPVMVLLEADGFAYMQQQSGNNLNAYSAIAASGLPELAGLPNTVAGWGMAFLQLRKAAGASNVILGIHVSGWATGADLFHASVTDALQPAVDSVYAFLSPMGLGANQTGGTYDVLVGDPLDRDADYYQALRGENRWWDMSDTASINSKSFNRYAEWLRLWNLKAGKRWVLWQIPVGNSSSLNVCNGGGPRQGYKDNRTEYFFGSAGSLHREKFATNGVISLLFGKGEGCQGSFENDLDASGQPYLKTHAGPFLNAGGLAIPSGSGTTATTSTTTTAPTTTTSTTTTTTATATATAPTTTTTTTAAGTDSSKFNFEAGTQGWDSSGNIPATLASSTAVAFAGTHALAATFGGAAAGTVSVGVANVTLTAGQTVAYHVWIPATAQLTSVQAFMQEGAVMSWRWTAQWVDAASLTRNAWNTINVTVPSNATPMQRMGVEFNVTGSTSTTVYVDALVAGAATTTATATTATTAPTTTATAPTTTAPAPLTGDTSLFNFESSAQGWSSAGDVPATVTAATGTAYSGSGALSASFGGSTGTMQVSVPNVALGAGKTVAFHLWIPAGAQLASVQPFMQEGADHGWRWTAQWVDAASLKRGAWNTINVTVPADAGQMQSVGVQLSVNGTASATVFVDAING